MTEQPGVTPEHDTSTIRGSGGRITALCSCGWWQDYADAQTAALACGRHATASLGPIPEAGA